MSEENRNLEALLEQLKTLKQEQKEFKKENKDIFIQNKNFNKEIGKVKAALSEAMVQAGETEVVHDGFTFSLKRTNPLKHDPTVLSEVVGDETKVNEYLKRVVVDKVDVNMTKRKKAKVE
jgi:hypothetical protein